MRNLRKLTAAVLAIALVLTSMTAAFAAETATAPVNGDKAIVLNELGLYAGISDKEFDPDLESQLTRQQSTVLLLKMFGLADKAAALTEEEVATALKGYTDADKVSSWAENSIAYAVTNNIMSGTSDTTIDPAANVTGAQFATLIVKTLGYDVPDFKLAVTQLSKVTGSKVTDEFATDDLTRDAAVGYMYGTLTAQTKLGATVIANLVAGNPAIADKAIEDGLYTAVNTTLVVDSVIAVANNKVKVELKDAGEASAADFAIVKKDSTTEVAVKSVAKESDKVYVLETEALTGGTKYTLTANAKSVNFTGIAADTSAPKVNKVSGKDTNTFEVEYSDKMDFATVTDIANYTFDKSIKAVKAELNGDRNTVTITTDAAKRSTIYTVTIKDVANSDGKVIVKTNMRVTAVEDKQIPRVATPKVQNNRMVVLTFTDTNDMDKASLETLSNYSINDLSILSAKAYDCNGDNDTVETVVLTTETQTANKSYTLTMENLVDGSVLANPLGKTTRTFRGAAEDKSLPTVKPGSVKSSNNNEVEITFVDNNAMDITSIEDISNYSITASNGDVLEILSAKAAKTEYPDIYTNKKVTLTTAPQDSANYKLEVKGVQDEFGNVIKATGKTTFAKSLTDYEAPHVVNVQYINDTRINVTFSEPLNESIAEDPTNYSINNDIGSAIKANLKDDKIVELTTQTLETNKSYEVTINNIEDTHGNSVRTDTKAKFKSRSTDLDLTAPSMTYIQTLSNKEIQISFDENVTTVPTDIDLVKVKSSDSDAWNDSNIISFTRAGDTGLIDGGKTVIYVTDTTTSLTDNASYKIYSTNGAVFADEAGNKISAYTPTAPAMSDRLEISGTNALNIDPEVSYIEQVNVNKIKVVFTKPVKARATSEGSKLKKIDTDVSDEYLSEWYYDNGSKFGVKDVTLYFSNIAQDALGRVAVDLDGSKGSTFSANLEDSTGPIIIGVEAINRRTIEVTYDEDLSFAGTHKIWRLNPTTNKKENFDSVSGSKDGSKVTLKVSKDLDAADIFYLETIVAAKDIATNKEDISGDTQFDFYGNDLRVSEYITGVVIINANTIKVTGTSDIALVVDVTDNTTSESAISIIDTTSISGKDATITLAVPVLSGINYTVEVMIDGSKYGHSFDGITPDMNIGLKSDGTLEFVTSEMNLYDFTAYSIEDIATEFTGLFDPKTATTTDDDTVTFTGITAGKYYVVATKKDGTAGVVYAALVEVE